MSCQRPSTKTLRPTAGSNRPNRCPAITVDNTAELYNCSEPFRICGGCSVNPVLQILPRFAGTGEEPIDATGIARRRESAALLEFLERLGMPWPAAGALHEREIVRDRGIFDGPLRSGRNLGRPGAAYPGRFRATEHGTDQKPLANHSRHRGHP